MNCWEHLKQFTWVPIPTSKTTDDIHYDDRLIQILNKLKEMEPILDIRELLITIKSREPQHISKERLTIEKHLEHMSFNSSLMVPTPNRIILFDDIITTGETFKAAKSLIKNNLINVNVIGLFVARTIHVFQ